MVLNNQVIERLKDKSGLSLDKAKDFTILSASILDETKRYMGVTTIKRLIGYINDCRKTNEYTLNTIAMYLGCKSWNELCNSLRIDSDWNFEDEKVYVSDLEIGKMVSVIYWNREVTFEVVDFKGNKALRVTRVLNSSLKVGDILIIDCLEVGKILEAKEVYRDSLVGNYRTNNELSEINIA